MIISLLEIKINIFYLHPEAKTCAEMHLDRHVVKMIIEYAQLLSTAHRLLDGTLTVGLTKTGRKAKRYVLPDDREPHVYVATHSNHPSAKWTRHTKANYLWLFDLWVNLLDEYTHRYKKNHSCARLVPYLVRSPVNIPNGEFTPPWRAMPDDAKIGDDSLLSYRNYYITYKRKMARWTNREMPDWFAEGIYRNYGDTCFIDNDVKRSRIISQPLSHYAHV